MSGAAQHIFIVAAILRHCRAVHRAHVFFHEKASAQILAAEAVARDKGLLPAALRFHIRPVYLQMGVQQLHVIHAAGSEKLAPNLVYFFRRHAACNRAANLMYQQAAGQIINDRSVFRIQLRKARAAKASVERSIRAVAIIIHTCGVIRQALCGRNIAGSYSWCILFSSGIWILRTIIVCSAARYNAAGLIRGGLTAIASNRCRCLNRACRRRARLINIWIIALADMRVLLHSVRRWQVGAASGRARGSSCCVWRE